MSSYGQYPELLISLARRDADSYSVESRFTAPGADAEVEQEPGSVTFDFDALDGAYYEDELGPAKGFGRGYGFAFDSNKFKEFWEKSAREFEDMGEFIRESIDEWLRHKKEATRTETQDKTKTT